MDFLSIFGSKPIKKFEFPLSSNRRCDPIDMSALDNDLNETRSSTIAIGKDYAKDYIKEEEERMLAESNPLRTIRVNSSGKNFEEISMSTAPPLPHELDSEELNKIYKSYNFDYRPNESLPIALQKNHIVSMIETRSVIIIQGPTGCGKTTQVPQFILDACYQKKVHCNIIVTQPRRIAAISIAKRVSEERSWPLGSIVGFQVGMVNNTSQDTRLTYCTTGVLLRKLICSKNMNDYTHVIIDEVHERDQDMDFLLTVVRKLKRTNSRTVKVILMSATFNAHKFSNYFTLASGNQLVPAAIIDIDKGNFFIVHDYYLCQMGALCQLPEVSANEPQVTLSMMKFCSVVLHMFDTLDIKDNHRSGVLVFLPGIAEIEEMHDLLTVQETQEKISPRWDVVVLHSSITNEEQQRIFEPPQCGYRRIILATNIAESSITVPDIKYVIDFCLMKQLVIDPVTNYQCLELSWASKTNCQQRAGRAGRLMDGRVYRLVPEKFYTNVLPEEGAPEMLRSPLENVVLNAKLLDMGEPKELLALSLDPPDLSNLERTILLLKETGALLNKDDDGEEVSRFDGNLTDLGRIMAQLPFDIHISKLIALGHVFSVLRESIIIGASMSVKNMFSAPFGQKLEGFTAKLVWANYSDSDCVAFLNAYSRWMHEKANGRLKNDTQEKKWAQRSFLQIRIMREIDALVNEVTGRLKNLEITETLGPERVILKEDEKALVIKIVIAGAFYPHFYTRKPNNEGIERFKMMGGLDPTKTVYLQGWPTNQPGPLYARRIQEYFKNCVDSKVAKILVSFDRTSRVFVQFRQNESPEEDNFNNNEEPGEISLSVYKAVKLRNIMRSKPYIDIPVLASDSSTQMAEKLGIKKDNWQILTTTEMADEQQSEEQPEITTLRPVLPGLDVSYIPLIIHRIVTPGHFWAQNHDDETATRLRTIQTTINSPESLKLFPALKGVPKIGSLVIAPREMSKKFVYRRAIIQNITVDTKKEPLAKVFYVDYGNVDHVRVCDLRELDKNNKIASIPALAFECVLAEIRPSTINNFSGNQSWSQEATDEFHRLLSGDVSIYGHIYSVVDSVLYLKLVRVDGRQKSLELNEHFVKLGYAQSKEEEYLSRCNHDLRENNTEIPLTRRQYYEDLQYEQTDVTAGCYPEPPELKDCRLSVQLRGPISPLEISLTSLTTAGLGKRIKIGNCSVNSVLLDANPENPHDRLLVAGSIHQTPSGHGLILRNTTLMPNIPGLTSLLCLIFTPQMELRRNSIASRYTGALCGLGYHPTTEYSLFPEHDLSVHFDTEITMDDLQDINRLRHWMSLGIYTKRDHDMGGIADNANQISVCQSRVKSVLFGLLDKRRNLVTRQLDTGFDRWRRYDDSLFILPGRDLHYKQNIFQLHAALDLNEKNDEREEMIDNIIELRDISTRHYKDPSTEKILCKLCNITVFGVFQLRLHINSTDHKLMELKFHPLPSN